MIKEIDLSKKAVKKRLGDVGSSKSRFILILIAEVFNLDVVKITARKMNRKFDSVKGHPAYDCLMFIGIELYCQNKNIDTYSGVVEELEDNATLKAFTDNNSPKYTTISSFLKEISTTWIKEIFYRHLVLNEYDPLNFDKIYIDGTDIIANASINYTIN